MDIVESIKSNFNRGYYNRAMKIEGLDPDFLAWTIKQDNYYAVAVPFYSGAPFYEQFSSVCIKTVNEVDIDGKSYNMIMLMCNDASLREDFAVICGQFVVPGDKGEDRYFLLNNPAQWWRNWKELMGNKSAETEAYPVIGELTVLEWLVKQGKRASWTGISSGVHDVEADNGSYEVKSTTSRYGYEITISSVYQLTAKGKLSLIFCRFERSDNGRSVDDLVKALTKLGYSCDELNKSLSKKGFETGRTSRSIRYDLIEMKEYIIDDDFPVITEHSFKGDKLPSHVIRFNYTIDLSGLKCKNLI